MRIGSPSSSSITLVNAAPMIAPGIADRSSSHASRCVGGVDGADADRMQRGTHVDEQVVCGSTRARRSACRGAGRRRTTSPANRYRRSRSNPNRSGTRRRWPLDEIGRNSERPCTIPRMMAWSVGKEHGCYGRHEGTLDVDAASSGGTSESVSTPFACASARQLRFVAVDEQRRPPSASSRPVPPLAPCVGAEHEDAGAPRPRSSARCSRAVGARARRSSRARRPRPRCAGAASR